MLKKILLIIFLLVLLLCAAAYLAFQYFAADTIAYQLSSTLQQQGVESANVAPPRLSLNGILFPEIKGDISYEYGKDKNGNTLQQTEQAVIKNLDINLNLWQLYNSFNYFRKAIKEEKFITDEGFPLLPIKGFSIGELSAPSPIGEVSINNINFHYNRDTLRLETEIVSEPLKVKKLSINFNPDLGFLGSLNNIKIKINEQSEAINPGNISFTGNKNDTGYTVTLDLSESSDLPALNGSLTTGGNSTIAKFNTSELSINQITKILKIFDLSLPTGFDFKSGNIKLAGYFDSSQKIPQQYLVDLKSVSAGYAGFDFTDLAGYFSIAIPSTGTPRFIVKDLKLNFLDSIVKSSGFNFTTLDKPFKVPVTISDLALNKLLALYPESPVSGDGIINATLPLIISNKGVIIENGSLSAKAPGGTLQYHGNDMPIPGLASQMAFISSTLKNFVYDQLKADVTLSEDGNLLFKTFIAGNNPEMNNTRPVNLNLNIEQNLYDLLKGIDAVKDIPGKSVK